MGALLSLAMRSAVAISSILMEVRGLAVPAGIGRLLKARSGISTTNSKFAAGSRNDEIIDSATSHLDEMKEDEEWMGLSDATREVQGLLTKLREAELPH